MNRWILKTLAYVALGVSTDAVAAQQLTVVVPNGFEDVEGNDGDGLVDLISGTGMRYQQVYPASQFLALPSGLVLTAIRNRPDGAISDPFSVIPTDVTIRLSTTDKEPGQLSGVFAENIGPDELTVFEEAAFVNETENIGPPGGPKEFDMGFLFQTPFPYYPSQGNLLFDLTMRGEVPQAGLDFQDSVDNPTEWVFSGDSNGAEATARGRRTPVTMFVFVPEPSTIGLLALGVMGVLVRMWSSKEL